MEANNQFNEAQRINDDLQVSLFQISKTKMFYKEDQKQTELERNKAAEDYNLLQTEFNVTI